MLEADRCRVLRTTSTEYHHNILRQQQARIQSELSRRPHVFRTNNHNNSLVSGTQNRRSCFSQGASPARHERGLLQSRVLGKVFQILRHVM